MSARAAAMLESLEDFKVSALSVFELFRKAVSTTGICDPKELAIQHTLLSPSLPRAQRRSKTYGVLYGIGTPDTRLLSRVTARLSEYRTSGVDARPHRGR